MGDSVILRVFGPTMLEPARHLTSMQRTVLAALALRSPHAVFVDGLIDLVWGPDPPRSARAAVQNQISRLRGILPEGALVSENGGYQWLGLVDLQMAQQAVLTAEAQLRRNADRAAFDTTDRVLSDIAGEPFADLSSTAEVVRARQHADAVVVSLENLRLRAGLAGEMTDWAVTEAQRMAAERPHDERRCIWLAQSLDTAGRRGDALAVISRFRRRIREELGLGTTRALAEVEHAILSDESTTDRAMRRGDPVGRADVVAALLADVQSGRPVVVGGEPGIGVTTVLSLLHVAASRAGLTVAHTRCPRGPEPVVLGVLEELLTELGAPPSHTWSVLSDFARTLRAYDGQVLLIVDDADAAGPTTLRALADAAEATNVRLAIGTHSAPDALHPVEGVHHPLYPLTADEVKQVISSRHDDVPPDEEELGHYLAATAGNPLLLHTLLQHPSDLELAGSPHELADVVRTRLAKLSPRAREALIWIAAADGSLPVSLLREAHPGVDEVGEEDPGLIDGATMTFRHGAIQRVVTFEVSQERQAEVHHTLATLGRQHGLSPVVVMHHAVRAASLDLEGAVAASRAAALDATRRGAHAEAASCLGTAVDLLASGEVSLEERLDLQIAHGDELRLAGDPGHTSILQEAAAEALQHGLSEQLATAMFALLQLGSTDVAGTVDARTVELAEATFDHLDNTKERALVGAAASMTLSMHGELDRALDLFLSSEQLATDPRTRRRVLPFAYLTLGHPDHRQLRGRLVRELLDMGTAEEDSLALWEGLHLQFSQKALVGDGEGMREAHFAMLELLPSIADVGRVWSQQFQHATLAHLDGDFATSRTIAWEAFRSFVSVSESRAVAALYGQLLGIHLAEGTTGELVPALQTIVAAQPGIPAWHAALGHALVQADPDGARRQLELARELARRDFTWLASHSVAARAAALLGDAAQAAPHVEALAPYSELAVWQGTCVYGPVGTALALAGAVTGDPRARDWAEAGLTTARRLKSPVFIAEAEALLR